MSINDQKNKKTSKSNRQRYFHMVITPSITQSKMFLWTVSHTSLIEILLSSNFVSKKFLETVLFKLKILDRGRTIYMENFEGQLQRDLRGIPYWNVYLQTTGLLTSRCLTRAISEELFKIKNSSGINIRISPLSAFLRCDRKRLFMIPKSDFYPGYLSRSIFELKELLKREEIKKAIQQSPEEYQALIETTNKE